MWILCFLAAFCYCAYALKKTSIEFFSFNTNTQISFERLPKIEFPTVTFCNKEMIQMTRIQNYKQFIDEMMYNIENKLIYNLSSLDIMNFLEYEIKYRGLIANLTYYEKSLLSLSLSDILVSCRFNNIECGYESFNSFFSDISGNCFQFNSRENHGMFYLCNNKMKFLISNGL